MPMAPVAHAPMAPAPQPAMAAGGAQQAVGTWLADIDARQRMREEGPAASTMDSVGDSWRRGDDDIIPARLLKKRGRSR
jgi:hypothetical protein